MKLLQEGLSLMEIASDANVGRTNPNFILRSVRARTRTRAIRHRRWIKAGNSGITIAAIRANNCTVLRPTAIIRSAEKIGWAPMTGGTVATYCVVGDAIR